MSERHRAWAAARLAAVLLLAGPAAVTRVHAEVKQAAPDGFLVVEAAPVKATAGEAWAALIQPQHWWGRGQTWSGDPANLHLDPVAGGCLCERWPGGSAEHGRVVMVLDGQLLRLEAELGPLQERALDGVLSFWIATDADGVTRIEIDYRVNGNAAARLRGHAPEADAVLAMQLGRLVRYIDTGDPAAPEETPATEPPSAADQRTALFQAWAQEMQQRARKTPPARAGKDDGPSH
jgi:hypothetical protein